MTIRTEAPSARAYRNAKGSKGSRRHTDFQPDLQRTPHVLPTQERSAKHGGVEVRGAAVRVRAECTLDRCLLRGWINGEQHEAGMRLFRDFYFAGMEPSTRGWDFENIRTSSGYASGRESFTERQLQARERFWRAMDALGRISRRFAWDVCCLGHTLKEMEEALHYRRDGFATERLRETLDDLTAHYQRKGRG